VRQVQPRWKRYEDLATTPGFSARFATSLAFAVTSPSHPTGSTPPISTVERVNALKNLLDLKVAGAIDDAEYEALRAELNGEASHTAPPVNESRVATIEFVSKRNATLISSFLHRAAPSLSVQVREEILEATCRGIPRDVEATSVAAAEELVSLINRRGGRASLKS